ncbi:MAG TPA: hypothetical protein DEH05_16780, partial [Propionibacteriaceae bacterium]|nr:hypothetical protein [Propionibacteriaceae bacterium]
MRRATLLRTTRAVLIGLVLVAAVAALWRNWSEVSATLASLEVRTWLPSLLAVPVGIACATMSWQVFVDDLGTCLLYTS